MLVFQYMMCASIVIFTLFCLPHLVSHAPYNLGIYLEPGSRKMVVGSYRYTRSRLPCAKKRAITVSHVPSSGFLLPRLSQICVAMLDTSR